MAAFRRRMNRVLSAAFPEKRIFIQSEGATRYLRVSPASQFAMASGGLVLLGWMAVATGSAVSGYLGSDGGVEGTATLREAYRMRLDELAAERDQRAVEARSAQGRFEVAMQQIGRQQTELLSAIQERRELSDALDTMRGTLQQTVAARDAALAAGPRRRLLLRPGRPTPISRRSCAPCRWRSAIRRARGMPRRPRTRRWRSRLRICS